ncbi:MAG: NAD(P)H-dependent glycerol-3-phosphate dehydrogenase [Campylobacterales bacterium]|nr:NAD(P)H-dependent glycerol-3-phosphate dehydrogenase [Campylobacterales bacterium]
MTIGVIGAGKWGEALMEALSVKNKTIITSRTKKELDNFTSLDEVLKCEYILVAISAQATAKWLAENFKHTNQKIIVASKGIDLKSHKFLDEIYSQFIPKENLAFISGPSFAKEVKEKLPTALVISSESKDTSSFWADLFPDYIKTYISDDVKGAEVGGSYKNVIAIAAGVCDGLHLGNNARAALITRGLAEITRFGEFFGAKVETFLGLSGAGDLFLTASSVLSRNYRVGFGLAQGKNLDEVLKEIGETAEGVATTRAIVQIAKEKKLYTPIADEVEHLLDGKNPQQSLKDLLIRKKEEEF